LGLGISAAGGDAFSGDELKDKKVAERIKELAGELVRYGEALGR
jgi:hypothetical protein